MALVSLPRTIGGHSACGCSRSCPASTFLHLLLLGKHLPYDVTPLVMDTVQLKLSPVLLLDGIELAVQFVQQVDQRGEQFPFLLLGFLAVTAVVHVALADFIILAAGRRILNSPDSATIRSYVHSMDSHRSFSLVG